MRKSGATLTDAQTCVRGRAKIAAPRKPPGEGARGARAAACTSPAPLPVDYLWVFSHLARQSLRKARRAEPLTLRGVAW